MQSLYENIKESKTGKKVPVFADGKPANSLYDPEREAEKTELSLCGETFAVFAGLADGRRVKLFLEADPKNECIVIEKNAESVGFLAAIPEASYVIQNDRAKIICFQQGALANALLANYIPALFKNFTLDILQSWKNVCPNETALITKETEDALHTISQDFSTQATFGRIWFVNSIKNILRLNEITPYPPPPFAGDDKTAVVAAAGPSLESAVPGMRAGRRSLCLFSTDTALPVLTAGGLVPDFIVSIDPQYLSARHFSAAGRCLRKSAGREPPTLIIDMCGNPGVVEKARRLGCRIVVAAGGHPFSAYVRGFYPLPEITTSAGTVTATAIDAARRLGFSRVEIAGGDFAYTRGKPYARGTYLENHFCAAADKRSPLETLYTHLMFRTQTKAHIENDGAVTYRTAMLDNYKHAVEQAETPPKKWGGNPRVQFQPERFFAGFREALSNLSETQPQTFAGNRSEAAAFASVLPLAAFFRKKNPRDSREKILKMAIELALNMIEGYTGTIW